MYFNLVSEKAVKKFLASNLDYEILPNTKMVFDFENDLDSMKVVVSRQKDGEIAKEKLAVAYIDDFTCVCHLNPLSKENDEKIKFNGKYPKMQFNKEWRQAVAIDLEKNYGDAKADFYVEDFLDTNMGNVEEYNKLMFYVYRYSDDKAMLELYCKDLVE